MGTAAAENPAFAKLFTERTWTIIDRLIEVAKELGRSPAQVALNWITKRPGVTSTIIGATKLAQLDDNLTSLSFDIPAPLAAKLEEAGRPEVVHPYAFFDLAARTRISGGTSVRKEPSWYRPQ
ncbi:MAG TPA: aldo/keto reductase [Polyangiaceae bacterium]|nr:aldo/keto reductase [Polyangiaceae bacterium]